jgi:hypothetical protein
MDRYLNAFQVDLSDLTVELYEVDPQPAAEGHEQFRRMNTHAMQLSDQVGGYAHYYNLGGTWYAAVLGPRERSTVVSSVSHRDLRYHTEVTLDPGEKRDRKLLARVFFDALDDHLKRENEFWLDDSNNGKRVYTAEPEQTIRGFDVCPGAKLRLDGEEGPILTIDPTLTVRGEDTLADFIEDDTTSIEQIRNVMDDRYIFEKNDRQTVKLVDILDEPVCEREVDSGRTVLEYARQEYDDSYAGRIDPDEPAVLVSYGRGEDYAAPPSLLRYNPVDDFPDEISQEASFDPAERWRRTRRFREVVEQFDIGTVSVEVDTEPIERDPLHYSYPVLTFGAEETVEMALGLENRTREGEEITREYWNPIKGGYLEKFGPNQPVLGSVETAVVFPERHEEEALDFYDDLREYADGKLNLSLAEQPAEFAVDRPGDMDELRDRPERFDGVVGFLSEYDEETYYRLIGDVDGRPLQVVTNEGLRTTPREVMLQNTATGFAAKLGVVPFTLKEGQLSTQAYLGLNVDGGERGTASAVVISGETNEILYQTEGEESTGRSSVPTTDRAKRIVRDAIRHVLKKDNHVDTLESLTIHRNGFFGNEEEKGIEDGIDQLRDRDRLPEDFRWVGVEVTHNSPHRLYDDNGMPQMGSQARLGEETAVVVTTDVEDLDQGSPQTLRCHIAAGTGDFDAYEVGRDVFFLSELNWGSPSKGTKDPITVLLTREMNRRLSDEEVSKLRYPPF